MNANTFGTKYDVVRYAVKASGMRNVTVPDDSDCVLIWNDSPLPGERIASLKSFQRVNHFPGMNEICRKDSLARNMNALKQRDPENFNFTPQTWTFPGEASDFQRYLNEDPTRQDACYIAKPPNQAMGKGIRLHLHASEIPRSEPLVLQQYISNPFLIEGFKFDLRIYVLVTSCDPLRIFLFPEGLVRFSTEAYEAPNQVNIYHRCMHLTNYSVNKDSENYRKSSNNYHEGSKRSLDFLFSYLRKVKHPNASTLWSSIADVITKTLIVAEPYLFDSYRVTRPFDHSSYNLNCLFDDISDRKQGGTFYDDSVCFEILGFDILLDDTLKPWLLEVNRSPSFRTSEQIDVETKSQVLMDAFTLLNLKRLAAKQRRAVSLEQQQRSLKRLFNTSTTSGTSTNGIANKDSLPLLGTFDRSGSNSTSSIAPSSPGVFSRTYTQKRLQPSNTLPSLTDAIGSNALTRRTPRSSSPNLDDDQDSVLTDPPSAPSAPSSRSPFRKTHGVDKELEEMKSLLIRIRIQEDRFEYETSETCANIRFKRIFPCADHISQNRYTEMLKTAFKAFLDYKITDEFLKYLAVTYDCRVTEDDVKQMLNQRNKIHPSSADSASVHRTLSPSRGPAARKASVYGSLSRERSFVGSFSRVRVTTAHLAKKDGRRGTQASLLDNRLGSRTSTMPV